MTRTVLAVMAVALLVLLVGCAPAATDAQPAAASAAPAATATSVDPLDRYSDAERNFIDSFSGLGLTHADGPEGALNVGEVMCIEIRSGRPGPSSAQALLTANDTVSDEQAEQVRRRAHDVLCPEAALPDPDAFGEGVYEVGVDMEPGTYRSPGGNNCYWERQDAGQETIANDIGSGPSVFVVQPDDAFVRLSRCIWTLSR